MNRPTRRLYAELPLRRRTQLAAYREGYAEAPSWTFIGEAFEASSLRAELQEAFFLGFNDRLAEDAKNEHAS